MAINEQTVRDIERLARLEAEPAARKALESHLARMAEYVSSLDALNLDNVEPLTFGVGGAVVLGEDTPAACLDPAAATRNAPEVEANLVVVPPVIEGGTA